MSSSSSNIHQRYTDRSSFDIRGTIPFYSTGWEINSILEDNLIAIGAGVRRETGKDVFETDPELNEWMQRVKKLGGAGETEDDERSKRLEEVYNTPCKHAFILRKLWRKEKRERSDEKVFIGISGELMI